MGTGLVVNPSASTANVSTSCFDVEVTTREDAECSGWVCGFCSVYTAWGASGDDGTAALVCSMCGGLEEREVLFVKRVLVGYGKSGDDGGDVDGDGDVGKD
jgi:hypothetical protein